jgi:hypothetical protein
MSVRRPSDLIKLNSAIAVRPQPLCEADLAAVRHAIAHIAPDWSVELEGASPDEATLVLLPVDGDDSIGPSFIVSREPGGFRVDQIHWDSPTEVGVFSSLGDVIATLRLRLAFCSGGVSSASVTLH